MITYWLVGEKASNPHRSKGHMKKCGNVFNPKSSLRSSKRCTFDLASSLDSPKKLRFAMDDQADLNGDADALESALGDHVTVSTSKRNSCPNLPEAGLCLLPKPSFQSHPLDRKVSMEPHKLSTTSLVEALTYNRPVANAHKPTKEICLMPKTYAPKIELSPPEESKGSAGSSAGADCWPLLDPRYIDECDRETCV